MAGRPYEGGHLHEPTRRARQPRTAGRYGHLDEAHARGFLPAFNKDSDTNERVVWHLDTALGDIELVQIAGAVARRIVPYVTVGAKVGRAERIGLIRLGSRVDVYLPQGIAPAVSVGDKTVAGVTGLDHG